MVLQPHHTDTKKKHHLPRQLLLMENFLTKCLIRCQSHQFWYSLFFTSHLVSILKINFKSQVCSSYWRVKINPFGCFRAFHSLHNMYHFLSFIVKGSAFLQLGGLDICWRLLLLIHNLVYNWVWWFCARWCHIQRWHCQTVNDPCLKCCWASLNFQLWFFIPNV